MFAPTVLSIHVAIDHVNNLVIDYVIDGIP